jgi:hypothetical protein
MAFVRVEDWNPGDQARDRANLRTENRSILDQIVWLIGGTCLRMILSTLATLAVHIALILFLLYRLSDVGPGPARAEGQRMTLIDIGDSDAQDEAAPQPEHQPAETQPPQAEQQPSADEITAPTAPEWTVAKIRVVHRDEAKSAPTPAAVAPAAPKVANSGGNGYDPYAGAAPQWRDPPPVWTARPSAAAVATPATPQLAPQVTATLRRLFAAAGIRSSPLRLRITVDAQGRVASIAFAPDIAETTMPRSVARMLQGRQLACFTGPQDCSASGVSGTDLDVAI